MKELLVTGCLILVVIAGLIGANSGYPDDNYIPPYSPLEIGFYLVVLAGLGYMIYVFEFKNTSITSNNLRSKD